MNAKTLNEIRYRARMGYPGSWGRAVKFSQAKADVAALVAEVENLQRAMSGFLAQIPQLAIQTRPPANDGGERGTDDERSTASGR